MKARKLELTNAQERLAREQEFHFPRTRFKFLNDHYGLRKKHIHLLAAEPGGGKSTIVRAIMEDMAPNPILFIGTEEDKDQQEIKYLRSGKTSQEMGHIFFVNERDLYDVSDPTKEDTKEYIRKIFLEAVNCGAKIIFFDNLTTSKYFKAQKLENQEFFIEELRSFVQKFEICAFLIIHIKRDKFSKGLPSMHEIRGGQTVTMRAENLYVVGKVKIPAAGILLDDEMKFFVLVEKDRHGDNTGRIYLLNYDKATQSVTGDEKVNWHKFKEFYDKRAKV